MGTWFAQHVIKIIVVLLAVDLIAFAYAEKLGRTLDYVIAAAAAYCAGPHPDVVPYVDGMMLCPGQSVVFVIRTEPEAGDDL